MPRKVPGIVDEATEDGVAGAVPGRSGTAPTGLPFARRSQAPAGDPVARPPSVPAVVRPGSSPWAGSPAPVGKVDTAGEPGISSGEAMLQPRSANVERVVPVYAAGATPNSADVLQVLWYEPGAVVRIRDEFKSRGASGPRPGAPQLFSPGAFHSSGGRALSDKEREEREVLKALSEVSPMTNAEIDSRMREAVDSSGGFVAPLVCIGGELAFPFDEVAVLRATLACVQPFTALDPRLAETAKTAESLVSSSWGKGSGGAAETMTGRLREAFSQTARTLPAGYLDAHTERVLIEAREFQVRDVFGMKCTRTLASVGALPAYIPESAVQLLPLGRALRVRLIGEAHPPQDPFETATKSLRVVALARVLPSFAAT